MHLLFQNSITDDSSFHLNSQIPFLLLAKEESPKLFSDIYGEYNVLNELQVQLNY